MSILKHILSLCIVFLAVNTSGQCQGQFLMQGGLNFRKSLKPEPFFQAGAGNELTERFFFGASIGVTKLEQRPKLYFPVTADIIYSFISESSWYPVLVVEPGFGYYSEKITVNEQEARISGGFAISAGGGLEHQMEGGGRIFFTGGLSRFVVGQVGNITGHKRIFLRAGIRI